MTPAQVIADLSLIFGGSISLVLAFNSALRWLNRFA